jgi:hypothetical protein
MADSLLGYFYANLKPDMTVDEIHKIVQGYEKAYRCRSSGAVYYYKEVFYYFSPDDNKALRFQIFFNKQEKFTDFQSEDDDSRMISINNCELGIIGR